MKLMKLKRSLFFTLISGTLLLGSCSGKPSSISDTAPAVSDSAVTASPDSTPNPIDPAQNTAPDPNVSQGGQVIEIGAYHLELITLTEDSGIHLDFYLQNGETHEAISGAIVRGEIQLPDGTSKTIAFEYDTEGKHFVGILTETIPGEYKVAMLTDINGEKVNGRFTFSF